MGSDAIKLPIIDLSNLKHGTPQWDAAKKQVRDAVEEYGCFEALFDDRIPQHLRKSTFDGLQNLFALPLETKLTNDGDKLARGFIKIPHIPLYESLAIPDALAPGNIEKFTTLMWPAGGNSSFSKSIESLSEHLFETDQMVRRMVLESLGLDKHMDEHLGSTDYTIRVQKYDAPKTQDPQTGLLPHTDPNLVTILYQNDVNALEILAKDGKQWIPVQPSPNSFIVMLGDSFWAWTNGWLRSCFHRVMMTGEEARYSIGLFSVPRKGYIIKAPEEMVDEKHPLLLKPYDYFEYMKFYLSNASPASPEKLKAYCGA